MAEAYLLPVDLRHGAAAERLIASGEAARLAGQAIGFTHLERLWRAGDETRRERLPWASVRHEPAFACLTAPRPAAYATPRLMGILNVTPDSFARDTRHPLADEAVAHGRRLAREGAAIIDVGGESTRPGAAAVEEDEELRRVLPVVKALAADGLTVSLDTRKATVMTAGTAAGARLINDVSGLAHDPAAPAAAAASGADIVLMHMRGEPATMNLAPSYRHPALEVFDELAAAIARAEAAGIPRARLILDPGLCFAKHEPDNLDVLRHLPLYHGLGCPLLVGVSRKGWTAAIHEQWRPADRLPATLAADFWALQQGVQLLRVHDVDAHRQLLLAWSALSQV